MMFKSKHSGWTWDLKRTPFGGGGGISNGFGIGDALASVDPSRAIGKGLAEVDKGVNQIPGGWITVGALAAGGAALAYAPEVMAYAAEAGLEPAIAAEQLGIPAIDVSTGEAVFGGADAALQGPTYGELGITGLSEGAAGPTYSELGYTGLNQQAAIDAANAASGMSASDVLTNANRAKNVANLLKQGSGLSSSLGQLAQGANPQGQALVNVVRGNQNPFSYAPQQPIQDTRQAQLASLLKQG